MRKAELLLVIGWLAAACSHGPAAIGPDAAGQVMPDGGGIDALPEVDCKQVDDTAQVAIATAGTADDYALRLDGSSVEATNWATSGNEAVVLEVSGAQRGLIGHLVLHQGKTNFAYGMHVGALAAGEVISVKVSPLSAATMKAATVCSAKLADAASLGAAAEGMINAPVFRWPVQKRFDDLPVVLGWSKSRKSYQTVFTNENGGTVEQCGGGASGIQAEIARWGRAADIEGSYGYGGAAPSWERCTGRVPVTTTPIRTEGTHPVLYYGDGHNRLFESRGGYGQTCGSGAPEKPNGDLAGWNVQNPSDALADDDGRVIILRPLPVDMDVLGYTSYGGRREALIDHYAPWLYRITALELAREGKIDNAKTFPMARYLYVDVRVSDVGGSGDSYCSATVTGGFKVRLYNAGGTEIASSPQITAPYAGGGGHDWKRVAIALPAGTKAADVDHFQFDAYDGDGIYLTAIGDAFIPVVQGPNGATLDYVRKGTKALTYYVDDNSNGCVNGSNSGGPGGGAYACAGSAVTIAK